MNYKNFVSILLIITFNNIIICQNTFKKGHYIDNHGIKKEGLIKNYDWLNNPIEFEFKKDANEQSKLLKIYDVQEVHIKNISTYKSFDVLIDESRSNFNQLSSSKEAIFKKKRLFLKLIFDGNDTDLYEYYGNGVRRFFYTHKDSKIKQLVYKKYLNEKQNRVEENSEFRVQIWKDLKCKSITLDKIRNLKYENKSLVKLFADYNSCLGYKSNITTNKRLPKDIYNISIRPRYNIVSLSIGKGASGPLSVPRELDFDGNSSLSLGVEIEYILPFNNNKWGLFIDPNYQNFNDEEILLYEGGYQSTNFIINYQTIDLPIGIRHYMFLNEKSKLFLNGEAHVNFDLKGEIYDENSRFSEELDVKSSSYFSLGFGYNFNNTLNIEIRSSLGKNIISSRAWSSDYQVFSLIVGYNIM